jgi:hypothetical protein
MTFIGNINNTDSKAFLRNSIEIFQVKNLTVSMIKVLYPSMQLKPANEEQKLLGLDSLSTGYNTLFKTV